MYGKRPIVQSIVAIRSLVQLAHGHAEVQTCQKSQLHFFSFQIRDLRRIARTKREIGNWRKKAPNTNKEKAAVLEVSR